MTGTPQISLRTIVLDCLDANAMADFYSRLLGWEVTYREPDWALIRNPNGGTGLSFQAETWYRPPVWPEEPEELTKMLHLDFLVDNLEAASAHALEAGATLASHQLREDLRIYLDPAGHPFCLFTD